MKKKFCSKIGGQAVLEGVMMKGERSYATAVRSFNGNIVVESGRLTPPKAWSKIPILRGIINFFFMLFNGSKITMRSAEVFGEEMESEEPSKFEKWLSKTLHIDVMSLALFIGVVLGLGLSLLLFFMLPTWITGWIEQLAKIKLHSIYYNLIEGGVRLTIFVSYMLLTSLMKEIKRLYMYHGAEHKTKSCFEAGLPLTVENARKMSKHHDRCGTSFVVIVMLISILLFSFVEYLLGLMGFVISELPYKPAVLRLIRIAVKLAMLPLVAGVSYELLKLLARFDNVFAKILKAPGLLIQRITTREPDDSMLEVAIKAFQTVQELDADPEKETTTFDVQKSYKKCREQVLSYLDGYEDKEAKADWIFTEVTGISRSRLPLIKTIYESQFNRCVDIAKAAKEGKPLQYAVGKQYFYGLEFKVDSNVLIPRQDTEILVEKALEVIKPDMSVLDMCTGSGCIAISVAKNSQASVTAVDVSEDALKIARENAEKLEANVEFILSDMFENVQDEYDVIVSNPPYIPTKELETLSIEVKAEPNLALDGGEDGLDFYRVLKNAPIKENGVILMEIGDTQAEAVKEIFDGFDVEVFKDYGGFDRVVKATKIKIDNE